MTKPVMFQTGADAVRLHEELVLTPINGTVTYERLGDVIGRPVSGSTGALITARRIAQRQDGMVFACIKGEGLKRLDSEGIVDLSSSKTKSVRRGARRVVGTLGLANFTELREASQRKAVAIASVLMVVADLARERSLHAVSIAASGCASRLPIQETLRALGLGGKPKEGGPTT